MPALRPWPAARVPGLSRLPVPSPSSSLSPWPPPGWLPRTPPARAGRPPAGSPRRPARPRPGAGRRWPCPRRPSAGLPGLRCPPLVLPHVFDDPCTVREEDLHRQLVLHLIADLAAGHAVIRGIALRIVQPVDPVIDVRSVELPVIAKHSAGDTA